MALTDERVPFTSLDEAVHLLDTPAEPWSIQLEVRVNGQLDEDRMRAAIPEALSHHPMARAKLLPARRTDKRWTWAITGALDLDPLKAVDCTDDADLDAVRAELHSLSVPLAESPPLRLRLARHPRGDVLMINANHAAFDGWGTLLVLRSIAKAYIHEKEPDPEIPLPKARDVEGLTRAEGVAERMRRLRALADKARDLATPPARLASQGGSDQPGYGIHQISVPVPEKPEHATVNDLLLAALNLAIAGWNVEQGTACRRISVLMPVNLRPPEWRNEVVTNFVSETRVATTPKDRKTPEALLEAIAAQTRRIKEGESAALMELLSKTGRLPLWLKQPLSPFIWMTGNRLVDTAVLSNLGEVDDEHLPDFGPEAGGVLGLWFSAPARMPCGLSLGAVSAVGMLHLAFRYRYPLWGPAAAMAFADRFVTELGVLQREVA
ncbi:MAG TPA: condensation domain-containing protein [Acidimicrobiales bacterium]|nr:condensation domain-containing protein [Acidimicrobiales bacterium]